MRAVFLTIVKSFMLLLMIYTIQAWQVVKANPTDTLPWVIDEEQLISIRVSEGISHILAESARRNIHVRVLILNKQDKNLKEIVDQQVIGLKNKLPPSFQEKTTFFVINVGTHKSAILLGDAQEKTDPLFQSLGRIQQRIVLPLLTEGLIDDALTQGVVALTTVLEGEHKTPLSFIEKIYVWLSGA